MTIAKKGKPICTLQEWEDQAGPKRKGQWKDDRSAAEAARAWLGDDAGSVMPAKVRAILESRREFGQVTKWSAEPEAQIAFDGRPGPCNADLLVHATDTRGDYVVVVEAKADEPFAELVGDALAAALDARLAKPQSRAFVRIEELAQSILGPRGDKASSLKSIRYQLLTATAGALAAAGARVGSTAPKVSRAVVLVHEFRTRLTSNELHDANARDLRVFVERLAHGTVTHVESDKLYGPFRVPGAPLFTAPPDLYIGKVVSDLRG